MLPPNNGSDIIKRVEYVFPSNVASTNDFFTHCHECICVILRHHQILCTHSHKHVLRCDQQNSWQALSYLCIVTLWKEFHICPWIVVSIVNQTSLTHSHMLICPCVVTLPNELHIITHTRPCIVTTPNEFHTFAHHHMTIPLVQLR